MAQPNQAIRRCLAAGFGAALVLGSEPSSARPMNAPPSFGLDSATPILVAHAEGAQIYECKADASGAAAWVFREPVATLISGGETVGRHYAGPSWALNDGGVVQGKVLVSVPGPTASDVPLLKLAVADRSGGGLLKDATVVLRLNPVGGVFKGTCSIVGDLHAEPYSADYLFLR